MHSDLKIWPVVTLLVVFLGLTVHFARRVQTPSIAIEVSPVCGYLAIIGGAAAIVALGFALAMLCAKRNQ